jgi:uncharacterized repeat protein (TIGR03803 family)
LDKVGNLYGTARSGGAYDDGVVFKLAPNRDGTWMESVLHSFAGGADGIAPYSGVIFDKRGNLYGTTEGGGPNDYGVVFKLTPNPDGTWTESVVHAFAGYPHDGYEPLGGLVFDAVGNLYGTTDLGGVYDYGTVFKLAPNPDGTWTESVLYSFTRGTDGGCSDARVIFDKVGDLYGTTDCSYDNLGNAFKLIPNPDGTWTESVLYSFTVGADGGSPNAGVIFDAAGNLYGTTDGGGAYGLAPSSSWRPTRTESVLHSFAGYPKTDLGPTGRLSSRRPAICTARRPPVGLTTRASCSS